MEQAKLKHRLILDLSMENPTRRLIEESLAELTVGKTFFCTHILVDDVWLDEYTEDGREPFWGQIPFITMEDV